jgi:hypothetical protein
MIQFTIQQINELLAELGKIPYAYSAPLVDGIKKIANEQLEQQAKAAQEQSIEKAEANSDSMAKE